MENKLVIFFLAVFILLSLIGYLGNIELLQTLQTTENGGSISSVPVFISVLVTIIYNVVLKLFCKRGNNE